jgi:hypothetical protein
LLAPTGIEPIRYELWLSINVVMPVRRYAGRRDLKSFLGFNVGIGVQASMIAYHTRRVRLACYRMGVWSTPRYRRISTRRLALRLSTVEFGARGLWLA